MVHTQISYAHDQLVNLSLPCAAAKTGTSCKAAVSVLVPVKNEAANLERCLSALEWADEVFVIDSQSNDLTVQVALQFGAHVVQFHFNGTYPKKKNWALENLPLRNQWVLIIDADEEVPSKLAVEIRERILIDDVDGYFLNSTYFFLGQPIYHCGYSECWNLRLFRHKLGRYEKMADNTAGRAGDNEVHEHVQLEGRSGYLYHTLRHYAYPTIAIWVEKHNRYAIWEATVHNHLLTEAIPRTIGRTKRIKRWLKRIYLRLPMRPFIRFIYSYLFRLGFLDGKPGLIFCILLAFYDFLAQANSYEQQMNRINGKNAQLGQTKNSRSKVKA